MGAKGQAFVSRPRPFSGSILMSHSDEHQRRSPDCQFFTLYASIKPNSGRPKKSRASKASRMSTQSNFTAVSEGVSIAETEANADETLLSTAESVKPTKPVKGGKKSSKAKRPVGKARGKAAKSKEEDPQIASSFLEPEDDDFEVKVLPSPAAALNSKKRKSEEISAAIGENGHTPTDKNDMEVQQPRAKRRNTRARASVAKAQEAPVTGSVGEDGIDAHMTDAEEMPPPSAPVSQKKAKGRKKRASSVARKVSTASTASKASLRAALPNDEEIDAALEADLDRPLTDDEADEEPVEIKQQPKGRRLTRTKPGPKIATASIAPTRRGTRASSVAVDESPMTDIDPQIQAAVAEDPEPSLEIGGESTQTCEVFLSPDATKPKAKTSRKASRQEQDQEKHTQEQVESVEKNAPVVDEGPPCEDALPKSRQVKSRQASRQLPTRNMSASNVPATHDIAEPISHNKSSILDTQTVQDDSGHETDASDLKQGRSKHPKKKLVGASKAKVAKKTATASRKAEDNVQAPVNKVQHQETDDASVVAPKDVNVIEIEANKPKSLREVAKVATIAKPSKAKGRVGKPKAVAQKDPAISSPEPKQALIEIQDTPTSPSPPSVHMTPQLALSPQSSDVENQPPSSRPATLRPPLSVPSPSKSQTTRIPLAATTPISSPSKGNLAKLQSTFPWAAVDLAQITDNTPSADKENGSLVFGKATGSAQNCLTSPEKKLTVEEWILFNAQRGEERLRTECERLVGKFEDEGVRALRTLEGIVCTQ